MPAIVFAMGVRYTSLLGSNAPEWRDVFSSVEMVRDKFGIKEGTWTMGCWVRLEIVSNGWLVLLDEEMVQRSEEYWYYFRGAVFCVGGAAISCKDVSGLDRTKEEGVPLLFETVVEIWFDFAPTLVSLVIHCSFGFWVLEQWSSLFFPMMNGLVCCYFDVLVCGGLSLVEVFCRGLLVGQVCSRVRTKLPPPHFGWMRNDWCFWEKGP